MTQKPDQRRLLRAAREGFVRQLRAGEAASLQADLARLAAPHLQHSKIVASYARYGDEIDPSALVTALGQQGARIAWPRVSAEGDTMTFHQCAAAALESGYRGILEPPAQARSVIPDTLLIPLVGVDRNGNRIGQGRGHYDRAVAALRAAAPATHLIGIAWDVQLVDHIAADPWDQRLDALATPTRWIDFRLT